MPIPTPITYQENQAQVALKAAFSILEKWQCTPQEKMILLGLRRSTLYHYLDAPKSIKVNPDLIERISYLLNIHAALRILLSNPSSVYGWVRKPNHAPFYNGKSAMDIMLQGRVIDLWSVSSRLNAERGGWA